MTLQLITRQEAHMFETLDKILYAGIGAVSMTKEKAEKLFDE